ncbi:hypothetical protein B0H17DRAFT_949075, partial [Mycena rosella]
CPQTYTVMSGNTCLLIESKTGVSDAQLHALDPSINSPCTGTFPFHLCMSIVADFTYNVVSGDTCVSIESKTGVSDSQLHVLNPPINGGCTNLQIGQVLCITGGWGVSSR